MRVHLQDTVRDVIGVREDGTRLVAALRDGAHRPRGRGRRRAAAPAREPARHLPRPSARCAASAAARQGPWRQVLRTYGIGAQILRDLGVTRMRVLSAPKQMHGLSAFGLEVVEYVDEAT